MMVALSHLADLANGMMWQGWIVFLRIGAAMFVLPAFSEQSVPTRLRLALALVMTAVVAPALPPMISDKPETSALIRYSVTEPVIGLILGIGVRMFIFALQTAGSIAAQATSLAQLLGSAGGVPLPAIGHLLTLAGLALLVIAGVHVQAAVYLINSYDLFPVGGFPAAGAVSQWGITQVSKSFALAFTLAAPFVILSALYNLTLGIINRAMPQLMVAFVGAPVITLGALVVLVLVTPILLIEWRTALELFLSNPFGVRP